MADTQTLSDPFKLPKGNADTSGKIPGQKDYNKNSQTKNTYKIDIPTRAGQTTGANENNPVAVYRVGVTQPIGTITSQSGFTSNPTYYSGVSAAEEKIRKAEQRAVREQTVEINKQVIKPTAEKAKIKPPIKNNDAATDSQSADKTTPAAAQSTDTGEESGGTKSTDFGHHIYPLGLGSTKQDVIKFTMLKYLPSKGITAPFMYAAFSEAIKDTTSAISVASENLPRGIDSAISCLRLSPNSAVISVSTNPGAITLAVMPRLPNSRANDRAMPISPDLLAE